ncbi:hydrogenase formation protein HypD [Elusimicrobiota bacterium]
MPKIQKKLNFMEVCGTHTMCIAEFGLKKLFPENVNMLSGPGCPVCVTPIEDIDRSVELSKFKDVIITTFGDMIRVPGSVSSLEIERSKGADVRIVYSPLDAVEIAKENPKKEIVFIGVGFETTSPAIASTLIIAKKKGIKNFSVLPMFKTIPNALKTILDTKNKKIDGFLLPGHVSTIIGVTPYEFIPEKYKIPCVIGGFEPKDILRSVDMLISQISDGKPSVEIQYTRAVSKEGNKEARKILSQVFIQTDSNWRAIGNIPMSGLTFNSSYLGFDATKRFDVKLPKAKEPRGCKCGEVLLGLKKPKQCGLFGKRCVPSDPVGPCMVSSEGSCAAVYKYEK